MKERRNLARIPTAPVVAGHAAREQRLATSELAYYLAKLVAVTVETRISSW
jgi:hypothetical protein